MYCIVYAIYVICVLTNSEVERTSRFPRKFPAICLLLAASENPELGKS